VRRVERDPARKMKIGFAVVGKSLVLRTISGRPRSVKLSVQNNEKLRHSPKSE